MSELIEKCMRAVTDIITGNDLVGVWEAFVTTDPGLQTYRARFGEKRFDEFMIIRDNTVENIGELCGGDYKSFVADVLEAYERDGTEYWKPSEDWLVKEPGDVYVSNEYADYAIEYVLDNIGVIGLMEKDAEGIAERFLTHVRKSFNVTEPPRINRSYIREILDEIWHDRPVSDEYWGRIADEILEEVCQDVEETADEEEWNEDDVRLAVGRVLCGKLGLEI